MNLKTGYRWKSIEGLSKGKFFKITEVAQDFITYKSEVSGMTYQADRKFFEKYLKRVEKYWKETKKSYKSKKEKLKNEK